MKNILLFIALAILGTAMMKNNQLNMTYLGNCGFLYESGKDKVIIDPFGTEFGNYFQLPSENTKENIIAGKAPFDKVDLLLITHIHGDHFNAKLTEYFLLNNSNAKMICPRQVYNQLKDSCSNFAQIESRIISPDLSFNESKQIKINGLTVQAIRMQHGTDRNLDGIHYSDYTEYEKTENLGYVINFNNKRVFHQGDGCLRINKKAVEKIDGTIDVAYLGYFDWDAASLNILKNELKAKNVIFMHGTIPGQEQKSEEFKKIASQLLFFDKEPECKTFR
ncbi:MAG TPA: MBL fold metallo-hydrolase [Prolixibacteraceae bacterium]|nr:MBL fold metallo-hydrolase [Prolixibacteraceae bacterium]